MTRRYFCATPLCETTEALLDGSEAHHLAHVLRARPGDQVVLFDGLGREYDASVREVQRGEVRLEVGAARAADRESPIEVQLGVALPKGERQRWLVEKAVELGVAELVPLVTQRSERNSEKGAGRLQRYVIEASKQCGRNRLMHIAEPQSWQAWLDEDANASEAAPRRWVAHPGGVPLGPLAAECQDSPVRVAVGPEGGFADAEIALAVACGWQTVDLGARILRIETAALTLAATAIVFASHLKTSSPPGERPKSSPSEPTP